MIQQAHLSETFGIDSAGTHGYHIGEAPDQRAINAAAKRGYDLRMLRARKLQSSDFEEFDYLLAMDKGHYRQMDNMPKRGKARIHMFTGFLDDADFDKDRDVPDPYYGALNGFDEVLDLVEKSSRALLDYLQKQ